MKTIKNIFLLSLLAAVILTTGCISSQKATTPESSASNEARPETVGQTTNSSEPSTSTTTKPDNSNASLSVSAPYMTDKERAMIQEINLVRSNPKGYIPIVEEYRAQIKKSNYTPDRINMEMEAMNSLIAELERLQPLPLLQPRKKLYKTAKNHGQDLKENNLKGHQGSNGSMPWDRIRKDDPKAGPASENLLGAVPEVRTVILVMLVDTNVPSLAHRKNLLSDQWEYVACYEVDQIRNMKPYWIQNFMARK